MKYYIKKGAKSLLLGNRFGQKVYKIISDCVRKKRMNMSDEDYFKKSFYENNGFYLDLDSPKTFNDKLIWLTLHERTSLKTKCADKYLVREYIKECGYEYILNKLYGVYHTIEEIEWEKMPDKFFIKTNHDSGTYALVDKKEGINKATRAKIENALNRNYYYESREWQYKDINPLIICEEYLETPDSYGLADYRFFCSKGQFLFLAVDLGTTEISGKHSMFAKRNLYDENFNLLKAKLKREHFDIELKKPNNFERMLDIAKDLSRPFKQVRVDFYNINGRIVFGELTFLNGGGMQVLEPFDFNKSIGEKIRL